MICSREIKIVALCLLGFILSIRAGGSELIDPKLGFISKCKIALLGLVSERASQHVEKILIGKKALVENRKGRPELLYQFVGRIDVGDALDQQPPHIGLGIVMDVENIPVLPQKGGPNTVEHKKAVIGVLNTALYSGDHWVELEDKPLEVQPASSFFIRGDNWGAPCRFRATVLAATARLYGYNARLVSGWVGNHKGEPPNHTYVEFPDLKIVADPTFSSDLFSTSEYYRKRDGTIVRPD